jgi:hypothetical protein
MRIKMFTVSAEWMKACGKGEEAKSFPIVSEQEFIRSPKGFHIFYKLEVSPGYTWIVAACRGKVETGEE